MLSDQWKQVITPILRLTMLPAQEQPAPGDETTGGPARPAGHRGCWRRDRNCCPRFLTSARSAVGGTRWLGCSLWESLR